jgi:uncharacterized protein (TIGR02453 family)
MTAPAFDGFAPAAFAWFEQLEDDNSRAWFAAHRDVFEREVRDPMAALLELVAAEEGGRFRLARQHRDTRFSHDKSPYKTRTYGLVEERPGTLAPLYLEVAADGLFAGTGYRNLAADQLDRFRAAVDEETTGEALADAVAAAEAAGVEVFGEALKRAPRGWPADHPRVRLLRHKMLVAGRRLAPSRDGIAPDAALAHARATWAAIAPTTAWLDRHVGASELPPPPSRFRRAAG